MPNGYVGHILRNLAAYPGIVEEESEVEKINSMLTVLHNAGLYSLVDNFCNNPDARDILFEVWIAHLLMANDRVRNLVYEPKDETRPPDFRFSMDDVNFDIQVKRLYNTKNEMTKLLFHRECERRLSLIPKPWFMNVCVSDEFERQHLNEFFSYIRANVDSFSPTPDLSAAVRANQSSWAKDGKWLVRFSFMEKNSGIPGICLGIVDESGSENGMFRAVDVDATRKAVERQLKKSKPTLTRNVSETQSNIVIIQAANNLWMHRDTMSAVLYGEDSTSFMMAQDGTWMQQDHNAPGGLFDGRRFSSISAVILASQKARPMDDQFTGEYFANPMYLRLAYGHPVPFESMKFRVLPEWVGTNPWRPMTFHESGGGAA